MCYFGAGTILMLILITIIYWVSNPFDILIIKASPKYLFRRCIWQKLAIFQICHAVNMMAMGLFITITSYFNSQKKDANSRFDEYLKDDLVYSTGIIFVFFIWRYAVSYYAVSFHSVSMTKRRFEKQFGEEGTEFAHDQEPIKSSVQLGDLLTSVLKTYSDVLLSCALVSFAMNMYHWEFNSYATYYLGKGYFNSIALYASVLISVNIGAELFRYLTRKSLMYEDDRQNFRNLRFPLFVFYITVLVVYQSLSLLIILMNKPEMIKIFDPYHPQNSINNLSTSCYILIHSNTKLPKL